MTVSANRKPESALPRLPASWAETLPRAGSSSEPGWLRDLQASAGQHLLAAGLPGNKDEPFKYTSLRLLEEMNPRLGFNSATVASTAPVPAVLSGSKFGFQIQNGRLHGAEDELPPGVRVQSISKVVDGDTDASRRLRGMLESIELHGRAQAFAALNTAELQHGLVIHVQAGIDAGQCLSQWNRSGQGSSRLENFRLVLILEAGARLSLLEHFGDNEAGNELFSGHALNQVLQVALDTHAKLDHVLLQQLHSSQILITHSEIQQAAGSDYRYTGFDLGGGLVRHDVSSRLIGEGAQVSVNGAFLVGQTSLVDNHVLVEHQAKNCSSDQFFRGVLGGHSRGVFNGKALIHEGADGSKVRQSSANLLLSESAEIDTKPELEIYADEVEASHGATVGQLDEQAIFYLRSRGLDEARARLILTSAFCRTISTRLRDVHLAERINLLLDNAMPGDSASDNRAH